MDTESTVPDFYVLNTRNNKGTYIEITRGRLSHPRKKKQKKIMKAHSVKYVQLGSSNLEMINNSSQRKKI